MRRGSLLLLAVPLLVSGGALVWRLRGGHEAKRAPAGPRPAAEPPAVVEPPPADTPIDDKPEVISQEPSEVHAVAPLETRPEEPLPMDERRFRAVRALELIDETIVRTEQDLATAERAGDDKGAQTARIRLQRLRKVRAERVAELERIRP